MNHPVAQVELWKKYIAFEKSNPLRSEDTALVTRRVMFATEQCLLVLTHHPAVWHQAAQYLDQSSKLLTEKGVRMIYCYYLGCCSCCVFISMRSSCGHRVRILCVGPLAALLSLPMLILLRHTNIHNNLRINSIPDDGLKTISLVHLFQFDDANLEWRCVVK